MKKVDGEDLWLITFDSGDASLDALLVVNPCMDCVMEFCCRHISPVDGDSDAAPTEGFDLCPFLALTAGGILFGVLCLIVGISGDFIVGMLLFGLLAALSKSKSFSMALSLKAYAGAGDAGLMLGWN